MLTGLVQAELAMARVLAAGGTHVPRLVAATVQVGVLHKLRAASCRGASAKRGCTKKNTPCSSALSACPLGLFGMCCPVGHARRQQHPWGS